MIRIFEVLTTKFLNINESNRKMDMGYKLKFVALIDDLNI